jgi:hypothetical protein
MSTNKISGREKHPQDGKHKTRSKISVTAEAKADRWRGRHLLNRARRYLDANNMKGWQKLIEANSSDTELGKQLNNLLQERIANEVKVKSVPND